MEDAPLADDYGSFLVEDGTVAGELSVTEGQLPLDLGEQERELRRLVASRSTPQGVVLRGQIVLMTVFEGCTVSSAARALSTTRDTTRKWTRRYRHCPDTTALKDLHRVGRPRRLTARDDVVVISLACQKPEDLGRLECRMFQWVIVQEAAKQGRHLSRSSVQRILARAEVKPHKERYYLFSRKDDPEYRVRRDAICDVYLADLPQDEIVVCMDEKTGMQILSTPKSTPDGGWLGPGYGKPALQEQHYRRHGSRSLVAAVNPGSGELVHAAVFGSGEYKTPQTIDFLRDIAARLSSYRVIHLVWDNASTHRSAAMRAYLASPEAAQFEVRYTPVHASWLNLCENFFSRFTRRYLAGRRYDCADDCVLPAGVPTPQNSPAPEPFF